MEPNAEISMMKGFPALHQQYDFHTNSHTHKHNPISSLLNMQQADEEAQGYHTTLVANDSLPFAFTAFFPGRLHDFSPTIPRDEAKDQLHQSIVNERRLKRMISNRESARRSRMRKKKLMEDLQYQVQQARTANQQLSQKLFQLLEWNQQILKQNAQLKGKLSSLQLLLEVTCKSNANRPTAETSTPSLLY
jgi:hypothetical protein